MFYLWPQTSNTDSPPIQQNMPSNVSEYEAELERSGPSIELHLTDRDDGDAHSSTTFADDLFDPEDDIQHNSVLITDAPRSKKRKLSVSHDELLTARKRLFADDLGTRTCNIFYMEGERIDMRDPRSCNSQRKLFARIYNAMLYFSQCTFDEKNAIHRIMSLEAELTKKRLEKIKEEDYNDFHMKVPKAIMYLLFALDDIKYFRQENVIAQLVPVTCTLDEKIKDRLDVNGLELRNVNNSVSLSVKLNLDVKMLYAGRFQMRTIQDQGDKFYVSPTACMGNYMNGVVNDLYDLIYDRTKEYITKFLQRHPDDPVSKKTSDIYSEVDERNIYTSKSAKCKDLEDKKTLIYLLNSVGREVNLRRMDLDRSNVFVLTSAMKTKPKYLSAKSNLTFSVESTPIVDAEAVFLSSYIRARIMEDGSLNFQIYSRTCMYMSEDPEFPK